MGWWDRIKQRLTGKPDLSVELDEIIAPQPVPVRLAEGTPPRNRERRTHPRPYMKAGLKVLIIDDSATICAMLGKLMRQNHCQTLEAPDAERGLEVAFAERPDLIYLDIVLPGINGFAALRRLRREPETTNTPVIMISGNAMATEAYYAQRIGADDFMKKPFARQEVFARFERLLNEDGVPVRAPHSPHLRAPPAGVA